MDEIEFVLTEEDIEHANHFLRAVYHFVDLCVDMDIPLPHVGLSLTGVAHVTPNEVHFPFSEDASTYSPYMILCLLGSYIAQLGVTEEHRDMVGDFVASLLDCCSVSPPSAWNEGAVCKGLCKDEREKIESREEDPEAEESAESDDNGVVQEL